MSIEKKGLPEVTVTPSLCDQWAELQQRIDDLQAEIESCRDDFDNTKAFDRLQSELGAAKKSLKKITERLAELERNAPAWAKLPGRDLTGCDDSDPNAKPAVVTAADTSPSQFFPLEAHPSAESPGMMISLSGVLQRAADVFDKHRTSKHLAFPLRQLNEHIELLRSAQSDGDAARRLAQFLRVWVKN